MAKYHNIMVIGRAIMYRIRLVKLKRRKTFPAKPHTNELAFKAIHLNKVSTSDQKTKWRYVKDMGILS